jgi:hypothetical protein
MQSWTIFWHQRIPWVWLKNINPQKRSKKWMISEQMGVC